MVKKTTLLSTVLSLSMSSLALSYDFSSADGLFANRYKGATDQEKFESATSARKAYETALNSGQLDGEGKIYAVSQMGRLDLLRAAMLDGVDKKTRRTALESCIDMVEQIASTGRQEYHYFKIACIALRGKIADGMIDRAKYGLKMKFAQDAALKATQVDGRYVGGYEAGGILRIMAAVRGNRKAKPLGLYNPKEGLEFAKAALATSKSTYRPFTHEYSGKDYYENYYYYGQAMVSLGLETEDQETVKKGAELLTKIGNLVREKEASLPSERKPERDYYVKLMFELNDQVQRCVDRSNWASCLQNELEKEE